VPGRVLKLFIDAGGTHLRSLLSGLDEPVSEKVSSSENDLISFIEKYLQRFDGIDFVGISFAGSVSEGRVLSTVNLEVSQKNIKEYFESRYDLRLEIDNDLNCAVIAEAEYFGSDSIAALYVGTGLGAAVIDRGRVIRGCSNRAFELGHIPYRRAPFRCGCGRYDCIENYASGIALQKWRAYEEGLEEYQDVAVDLATLAKSNPPVVQGFKEALLHALATLVTIADPAVVVIGGGVIASNPDLVDWLRSNLPSKLMHGDMKGLQLFQSKLENAALRGAALLEKI